MDIINKDLNLLRIFVVLAEEKSLSLAAKKLNLSQPALSYQLKRLREEFSEPLFIRTRRGYLLTEKAESLIEQIKPILSQAANLYFAPKFDLKTHEQEFILASTTYFEAVVIERLLKVLRDKAPHISIKTISLNDQVPTKELESAQYDLAVAAYFKELPKAFYLKKIGKDFQTCVVRKNHPLVNSKFDLKSYISQDHIKINVPSDVTSRVDQLLKSKKLPERNIIGQFNNFLTPPLVLKKSDAILTVPAKLARIYETHFGLQAVPFPGPKLEIEIKMLWHDRQNQDPFHKWIRSEIEKIYVEDVN